jgi:alpha-beta hydrolase superfamily lysophospholipase
MHFFQTMSKENIMSLLFQIVMIYFILACFAYFFSNKLIFQKPRSGYRDSESVIKLKTRDGALISAVYFSNERAKYVILFNHGNATDIGYSVPLFQMLYHAGFSVLAYDYHGYGTSQGSPTESNAYQDVDAAYDYLTKDLQIEPDRIIAYGESVGAALAIDLASRKKVAGVIAQSPFVTAFRVITSIPLFPFDKFNNLKKLKQISCPMLVIHGTRDLVIPVWHGKKVYKRANPPKYSYWVQGAGHNDIFLIAGERYLEVLDEFVSKLEK